MMGPSHAAAGALLWSVAAIPVTARLDIELTPATAVAGAFVAAGAGMLPDMDTPSSTVSRSFGPASQILARGIGILSGGHRHATHSILFVLATGVLTYAAVQAFGHNAALAIVFFLLGLAARGFNLAPSASTIQGWITTTTTAAVLTIIAALIVPPEFWVALPYIVAVGCFSHLLADAITPQGVPILWPLKSRLALPLLTRTGTTLETKLLMPAMLVGSIWLLAPQVA